MLVLTRKRGESILINGDEIEITVISVEGKQVKLAIQAPRSVTVHRKEVYDLIQAEKVALP